ncbi:response regulator transcription factor [bacterium SCSIO 12741]|nr:response regulator transcription factor [bacterium SCSIO 12741]
MGDADRAFEMLKFSNQLKDSLSESEIEKVLVEKGKQEELEISEKKIQELGQMKWMERYVFLILALVLISAVALAYWRMKSLKEKRKKEAAAAEAEIHAYQEKLDDLQHQVNEMLTQSKKADSPSLNLDHLNRYLKTPLTSRERDVLTQLALGKSNVEIAQELFVSTNTVGTHLKNIYSKLEVNNRVQAVKVATGISEVGAA